MASSSSIPGMSPLPTSPPEVMERIERNTTELVRWMKILVGAVVVLIVVTLLLFI